MIFRLDLAEWTSMLARWRGFSGKARYTSQLYTLKIHFCGILIKLASFILPMGRVSSSTANITNPKTDVSTHHISMAFTLSSVLTDYENEFCQKFSFEPPLMIMNRIWGVQEYFNSSWPSTTFVNPNSHCNWWPQMITGKKAPHPITMTTETFSSDFAFAVFWLKHVKVVNHLLISWSKLGIFLSHQTDGFQNGSR